MRPTPQPVSIAVDPALGRFVYTANYLGNSLSGFRLDPTAGTLATTQATPYPTRLQAYRGGDCAPRQPLHAVGNAVTASSTDDREPSHLAGLFAAR